MAGMEALQAQMAQLLQGQQAQAVEMAALRQHNEYLRQRAEEQAGIAALAQAIQDQNAANARRNRPTMVYNKGVGKPVVFTNREQDWIVWARKLRNFVVAVHEGAGPVLDWAATSDHEILEDDIRDSFGT